MRGKWYYEVRVSSAGVAQIGWASQRFRGSAGAGEGVGDDLHSWSFDGARVRKWHGLDEPFGRAWAAGDVVCCALDCDAGRIFFGLNGDYAAPMGAAFEGVDCEREGGLFPAASFNAASAPGHGDAASPQRLQFNFGSAGAEHSASWSGRSLRVPLAAASAAAALPIVGAGAAPPARSFAFGPPPGFRPLHYAFREARVAQFGRVGSGAGVGAAVGASLFSSASGPPQPLEDEAFLALATPASAVLADDRLSHDTLFEAAALRVPQERQMARELQGGAGSSSGTGPGAGSGGLGPLDISANAVRFFGRGGGYAGHGMELSAQNSPPAPAPAGVRVLPISSPFAADSGAAAAAAAAAAAGGYYGGGGRRKGGAAGQGGLLLPDHLAGEWPRRRSGACAFAHHPQTAPASPSKLTYAKSPPTLAQARAASLLTVRPGRATASAGAALRPRVTPAAALDSVRMAATAAHSRRSTFSLPLTRLRAPHAPASALLHGRPRRPAMSLALPVRSTDMALQSRSRCRTRPLRAR